MDQLIGISRVNQICGLTNGNGYMKGELLLEVMAKLNVNPVGADNSGYPLWFKSQVEAIKEDIRREAIPNSRNIDPFDSHGRNFDKEIKESASDIKRYIDVSFSSVDESLAKIVNCVQEIVRVQSEIKRDQLIINERITAMSSTVNGELKTIAKTIDSEFKRNEKVISQSIPDVAKELKSIRSQVGEIMKTSEKTRLNTLELVSRGS